MTVTVAASLLQILWALTIIIARVGSYSLKPESRTWIGCCSHHEAKELIALRKAHDTITTTKTIDLGYSVKELLLNDDGVHLLATGKLIATWDELKSIVNKGQGCWSLFDDGSKPWKISILSQSTGIPASLCPPLKTSGAPTMVLGGFTMHRIAGDSVNPMVDTEAKIASIAIKPGYRVLDTCLGLGYTAIEAAKRVGDSGRVTTIEIDTASIEMCSFNPWSQRLFDGSLPIEILEGDACKLVAEMPSQSFDAIIHDPPARALCRSDLYGKTFYAELRRVLKSKGQLFHYIGNPKSKESGRLYDGIITRLRSEGGFKRVETDEASFGIVAS